MRLANTSLFTYHYCMYRFKSVNPFNTLIHINSPVFYRRVDTLGTFTIIKFQ
jgi:hypothetical protein